MTNRGVSREAWVSGNLAEERDAAEALRDLGRNLARVRTPPGLPATHSITVTLLCCPPQPPPPCPGPPSPWTQSQILGFIDRCPVCARPRAGHKVDQATLGRVLCLSAKWAVGDHDIDLPGSTLRVEIRCMEGPVLGLRVWTPFSFTIQRTFIENLLCARQGAGRQP